MIEVKECSKAFGTVKAVNKATLDVGVRAVFGLVGSNGAGKSTLLRMMAGIIRPDEGEIQIDGMPVYENEEAKKLFFYISDDSYFPANYTAMDLVRFYRNFYPQFRTRFFHELMEQFHLEENRRIATFSKGMKKQVLVIIGVCAATKYLFCDETFDGLDPVMRQGSKEPVCVERSWELRIPLPVIASPQPAANWRISATMSGLLHKGGFCFQRSGGHEISHSQESSVC
ncbi:MAG: ATP-binding cassette domain-containing protein [Ruminococcus sp.]